MRVPQQDRSSATRAKVLDAAVETLLELGYANTTAAIVADRANVSRGAMQYHFRTKSELLAAAVEHLMAKRGIELHKAAERLASFEGADRARAVVDLLWTSSTDPLAIAWIELVLAARNDAELKPLVDDLGRRFSTAVKKSSIEMFGPEASDEFASVFVDMTLALLSGLVIARIAGVGGRQPKAREQRLLEAWKAAAPLLLAAAERST